MRLAAVLLVGATIVHAAGRLPIGTVPPGKGFLVFLSHHDDHTWQYGFGGLIARMTGAGWTGYYIRTTNDEKDSGTGWGQGDQINLKESREAIGHLGMKEVISLNWRNDHMDSIPLAELRAQFVLLLRKYRPDVVMAWSPWGHYDRNPDHRKVGRAIGEALYLARFENVYPEHAAAGLKPHEVPHVFFTQRSDYGKGYEPNVAIEIQPEHVRRSQEAFWAHKNVYNSPGTARAIRAELDRRGLTIAELEGLSDEQAIERLQKWSMEWWPRETGKRAGVRYAEAFYQWAEWDTLPGLREYLRDNVRSR
ncbi:MAG: PIG-L deacetylase family protein [Bryobacteraceae bacterium]